MATLAPSPVIYPESDGKPMADNTRQLRWIVVLYDNLCLRFDDQPDVFVGGNQNWYPVEGHTEVVAAPDVYVVFGRPKGDRPSWKQWEEDNVPLTVVFEILSPGNDPYEMIDKHTFYEDHGVEEYYVYDPDHNRLAVYLRKGELLVRHRQVDSFVSPRLGVRFDLSGPELTIYYPDGRPFLTFSELEKQRRLAEQRATDAEKRAADAEQRTARVLFLGRKARRGEATAEELAELERLEGE